MRQLVTWLAVVGLLLGLAACGDTSPELKKVGEKAGETWDAFKIVGQQTFQCRTEHVLARLFFQHLLVW